MKTPVTAKDRRSKRRFVIKRDLRFKIIKDDRVIMTGVGQTINISSAGVAFESATRIMGVKSGTLIELSIGWPVLLEETCLVRLVIFGEVVRASYRVMACKVERYEFRTQARVQPAGPRHSEPAPSRPQLVTPLKERKISAHSKETGELRPGPEPSTFPWRQTSARWFRS